MSYDLKKINSPVGWLYLVARKDKLCAIIFAKNWKEYQSRFTDLAERESPILKKAAKQLEEYFAGTREAFDIPYELTGTEFQQKVWRSLAAIPYGKTHTYKHQAHAIKAPRASRAIGRADGLNPLCIILPCHRVIGSNGKLTGYAGGLDAKRSLLAIEGIRVP